MRPLVVMVLVGLVGVLGKGMVSPMGLCKFIWVECNHSLLGRAPSKN